MDADVNPSAPTDLRPKHEQVELEKFFARPRKILETNTLTSHDLDVFQTWYSITEVNNLLDGWSLFRGKLKLTFMFTGNPTVYGMYRFWLEPSHQPDHYNQEIATNLVGFTNSSFTPTFNYPHVDIDFSQACMCELDLPYPGNHTYLPMESAGNDWVLHGRPVYPMFNVFGTTPAPLNMVVMAAYDEVRLDALHPQGLDDVRPQGGDSASTGAVSRTMDYAASIAAMIPVPFSTPLSKALEAGAAVARYAGYSRPPVEPNEAIVMRRNANFAAMSGQPDLGFHLGTDPSVARNLDLDVHPRFSQSGNINGLARRWGHIYTGDTHPGSLNYVHMAVPGSVDSDPVGLGGSYLYMTPLAFVASLFDMWTGKIEFRLQFVTSPMVRARYGIVILPPGVLAPATFPYEGDYLTHVVEVVGSTELEFEVPYMHFRNFRSTRFYDPSEVTSAETTFRIYELSPPTGPVADLYPYLNVYIRGGEDISFAAPTLSTLNNLTFADPDLVPQGKDVGFGVQSTAKFGEGYTELEALCKRFSPGGNIYDPGANPVGPYFMLPADGFLPLYGDVDYTPYAMAGNWTFHSYIRSAFLGYTGGTCHKFIPRTADGNKVTVTVATAANQEAGDGAPVVGGLPANTFTRGGAVFSSADHQIIEITIPDRSESSFKNGVGTFTGVGNGLGEVITFDVDNNLQWMLWYSAAADDFTLGDFLCPPTLYKPPPV